VAGADHDHVELFVELHGCGFPAKAHSGGLVTILATRPV
jgi:hypothetical protein